jgi:hypothetical protein
MKVYITYDRYEHDEWFRVDNIDTSLKRSLKKFKEQDLPSFLEYGPDDCHSYQLQRVEMTKKEYEQLLSWNEDPEQKLENFGDERNSDYFKFLQELYDNQEEVIRSTDGCSDFYEIVQFYGQMKGIDPEDFEDYEDELQEELCTNDSLRHEVVVEYVKRNY